jgi:hypothetical protein
MARKHKEALKPKDIKGLKYLRAFWDVLEPLRDITVHGNREFFMDQYVALLLLHFFNPVLNSLRALQEATGLGNVQEAVGVKRTSLGSMSESAGHVFDPELMVPILESVINQLPDLPRDGRVNWDLLPGRVRAMDGSFLRCLPKMTWAVFRTQSRNRGVKLHLQFDIQTGAPASADITVALGSEKKALRNRLQQGMLYLIDRGYTDYRLFQAIHDSLSCFVARLKSNSTHEVLVDRPLMQSDRQAGVVADQEVRMGSAYTEGHLTAPVRRIVIRDEEGNEVILLTNTNLPAEIVALLYRYRWQVELFFRWFKCILGCTHWLSTTQTGLTLQVYVALLASLLISLLTGRKPTRRTYRMICLYFQGWASAEELAAHIASLKKR